MALVLIDRTKFSRPNRPTQGIARHPALRAIPAPWFAWPATIGLLLAGCADSRINLDALTQLEADAGRIEPIPLETSDVALTEIRPYTVGTNDVLIITFTGLSEQFAQHRLTVRVHDEGTIMLPMVGKLAVAGLDLKGVEKALYEAHVPAYVKDLGVFVELGGPEATTVVVVGAAGQSGLVSLPRNERNVLYALSHAVGFGPDGSGIVHVKPLRPDRDVQSYDLTSVNDLRRALLAQPLESGDMIVVEPADPSAIYVTGLVNIPGPIPIPKNGNLSLARTIAAAGGLRDFLNPREATLWRRLANGEQVRVKLSLEDVLAGKTPDLALHPGDILDVPHTAETRFLEWVAANVRLGPFGVTAVYDPLADRRARILRNDNGNVWRESFLQTLRSGVGNVLVPPVQTTP